MRDENSGRALEAPAVRSFVSAKELDLGDIVWVHFPAEHHIGHEQYNEPDNPRPYVVMSNARFHAANTGLVHAVPLLGSANVNVWPQFRVQLGPDDFHKEEEGLRTGVQLAAPEQYRAISEERIVRRSKSKLSKKGIHRIRLSMIYIMGLDDIAK